ncbi:hypothetical protein Nepgr_028021 [Nepenthes gracilis]|uniref:Pentatricopeptide repeat-containing protein n=1 Tax=Nepenthes gracilis TaxID=150966 RepID=A0AAD3T9W3_NEPGR|nr:hypothetical protein Nepgr_028021 [Nepenthes gracilis]
MTLYMPLFRSCSTLRTLNQLHAHLLVTGLHYDPQSSTKLIESYAEMDSLKSAHRVFETYTNPDPFMWGVLIKCSVWSGFYREAILLYHRMLYVQVHLNAFIFPSILRASSGFGDLGVGKIIHGTVIKCGFETDNVVQTALLCMYGELGCIYHARKVFDKMSVWDVVSWSSMIFCYVQNGLASEGLEMFREMIFKGMEVDSVTMFAVAEACGELGFVHLTKSIHGYLLRQEVMSDDRSLDNSLIVMYSKCGDLGSAEKLFQNVTEKSVSTWIAMIISYNQNTHHGKALETFVKMQQSNVEPNSMTFMAVIYSCARLGLLNKAKSCHSYAIRRGIDPEYELLGPALIDLYAECGSPRDCRTMFERVKEKDIIMWNMLISVHKQKGLLEDALILFVQMHMQGFSPDTFTLSSALSASGSSGRYQLGCQIHSHLVKTGYSDEYVQNSLIDFYSKCGVLDSAYAIFIQFQGRSVITWNSMICGFSHNGKFVEAINLFDHMCSNHLEMNGITFLSVIQACSDSGYLEKGKWVHHKLIINGMRGDMQINTALVDMYAKCGEIKMAERVFDSMRDRSVVSWSAMLAGFAAHGDVKAAISLFTQMVNSGIKPNEVAFLNILSACTHAGYVEEGKLFYNSMTTGYGIEPKHEHFVCIVDLLSRAGDIDGAYRIIKSLPFMADVGIWSSLLNGCRIHRRMDIVQSIEDELLNTATTDAGNCTLLANIYAEDENWDEFERRRLAWPLRKDDTHKSRNGFLFSPFLHLCFLEMIYTDRYFEFLLEEARSI